MERTFAYPARFQSDEDNRILVTFPDLPGIATDGVDQAEAMIQARDALSVWLCERVSRGENLPPASKGKGLTLVWPSVFAAAKLALHVAFDEAKLSVSEVARRLAIDPKEVRRLLDPREPSKLVRMEEALQVLGYRLAASAGRMATPAQAPRVPRTTRRNRKAA